MVRHAKKFAHQVFTGLDYLRVGINWFGDKYKLVYPLDDLENGNGMRPYLEMVSIDILRRCSDFC